MTDPIPAATLVLFRERPAGRPELLMVERARTMAFAGGAMVFPGGRIDPGDQMLAATLPGDADENAARIAAIRETIEETGLAVGLDPLPSAHAVAAMRARLHAGDGIATVLSAVNAALAFDALIPFARWLPDHAPVRVFDTRFYLARVPRGASSASVDATENVRLIWTTAQDVLADADAGRVSIIYPTRRNLERLARFETFDAAVADAAAHPVRTITPFTEMRDGARHLCIPADRGYPVTSEPFDRAVRG